MATKINTNGKANRFGIGNLLAALVLAAIGGLLLVALNFSAPWQIRVPGGQGIPLKLQGADPDLQNNHMDPAMAARAAYWEHRRGEYETGPAELRERYFPGKVKDDLGIGPGTADKHFPGKEKDDLATGADR